jgi:hypothetical protein
MKRYSLLFLAILPIIFLSCKKDGAMPTDSAIGYIPADATQVSVIRLPQLMEKINFEELKTTDSYRQMIGEAYKNNPVSGSILENPAESGIDMAQNAYSVTTLNPNNPSDMLTTVVFNMGDTDKFNKTLEAANLSSSARDGNGYRYSMNETGFIAWNKEIAVAGATQGGSNPVAHLDRIFNMDESASMMASSSFEEVASAKGDLSFQLNSDALAGSVRQNPMAGMALAVAGITVDDIQGNIVNGSTSFDDQVMTTDLEFLLKDVIANDINMMLKSSVSTDFSPYIPGQRLSGVFTLGVDMKGLNQLAKEKAMLGAMAQQGPMAQAGGTPDDIAAAIDGDILLVMQAPTSPNAAASALLAISINEEAFEPLLQQMIQTKAITSEGDGVYLVNSDAFAKNTSDMLGSRGQASETKMVIKNDILFVSSDPVLTQAAASGGLPKGDRIDKKLYKSISAGTLGARIFPDDFKGAGTEVSTNIQSVLLTSKKGKAHIEVKSNDEGNFLRSMMDQLQ